MTFILRFLALALLASHAAAFHPGVARPCFGVRKAVSGGRDAERRRTTLFPGCYYDLAAPYRPIRFSHAFIPFLLNLYY